MTKYDEMSYEFFQYEKDDITSDKKSTYDNSHNENTINELMSNILNLKKITEQQNEQIEQNKLSDEDMIEQIRMSLIPFEQTYNKFREKLEIDRQSKNNKISVLRWDNMICTLRSIKKEQDRINLLENENIYQKYFDTFLIIFGIIVYFCWFCKQTNIL